ncbi:MAG: ribokinase [Microbacterium sp.]
MIVVGSITFDVSTISARLPAAGETVLGSDAFTALGGKGANQAVAAARSGARVSMVGAVGDDMFGSFVLGQLRQAEVDVDAISTHPGATGLAHIRIDAAGQNNIVMVPEANSLLTQSDVETALGRLAEQDAVLLTQFEIEPPVAIAAMIAARRRGMSVILDPAPWVETPDDVWQLVDVVTPNETEASKYTGFEVVDHASAEVAGRWFCDRGVTTAIVTLGANGAVVTTADGTAHHAAIEVSAVDSTAAGDTFTGFLGAALAAGEPVEAAVTRAMHAAAISVTRHGASSSIPTADDVSAFMQSGLSS